MKLSLLYQKKNLVGIAIGVALLVAALFLSRHMRLREGFQTAPDLSKYSIAARFVWGTDAAIKAAFGSSISSSTIEISKYPDFNTPVLSSSVNTLSNDNTEKTTYSIKDTDQTKAPVDATTIVSADIGQQIPESKSGYPLILNQYQIFNLSETPPAAVFPPDRPVLPLSFIGMRVNSSDALLKSFIAASASSGGPPPIIKDGVTSSILYDGTTDKLTTSTTKKEYDLIMDPTGSMPADPQVVDLAQIGKPADPTGVDKETIIKNYILKDNTNNTTLYKPALVAASTTAASTTAASTTAATATAATATAATTTAKAVTTTAQAKKDDGLSTGAIVTIALVSTAIIGGGIYFVVRKTSTSTPAPY